jgi:hypothetical protein
LSPNRTARPNHRPGLRSPNTTLSSGASASFDENDSLSSSFTVFETRNN